VKKRIDIEKLLQWAMREELPKGAGVSTSPWELLMRYCALGTRVDTSPGPSDPLGYVPGEPHADAVTIGKAVRALDRVSHFDDEGDVLALFGAWGGIAGDAVRMVMQASFNQRALVMTHAVIGNRPSWQFEHPVARPFEVEMPSANGNVRKAIIVKGINARGELISIKRTEGKARKNLWRV
jgi:hypothetical protein